MLLTDAATNSPLPSAAAHARQANASDLAVLLRDSRARTLALAHAYAAALGPAMPVPTTPELNPPLWELGHMGWFQEFWISRNPQRALGSHADPDCARSPSLLPAADAWYNSSKVPHTTRWQLPLPKLDDTLAYLAQTLDATLECLRNSAHNDDALYFYRLALFHEDMHTEAAVYMAQALGVHLDAALANPRTSQNPREPAASATPTPTARCTFEAETWTLGTAPERTPGFAFDNELASHRVEVPAFEIDSVVVSWRRYLDKLPTGHDGGSPSTAWPRYLRQRRHAQGAWVWEQNRFGQWCALDLDTPACHLSYDEVQAWCQRAGRTLPTEAQWEKAALSHAGFQWGEVWEWTASTFDAYPGFQAHPYRDYSAPWFGSRPVLRGASGATVARMVHPRYRNYFTPERTDIYAGFRTCARW